MVRGETSIQDDEIYFVYVTAADREEARALAQKAIVARLAACCNILPTIESIYEWQGRLEHAQETAFVLKTRAGHLGALEELIKAAHSYECPCIVAWPIARGNEAFLDWVRAQTSEAFGG